MTVKIAISLPDDIFADMKCAAAEQGQSRSALILAAVQKHLFDLETERMRKYLAELPDEVYALDEEDKAWLKWSLEENMTRMDHMDGGYPDANVHG